MSLDKAIEHGKEHRKPYTGCEAIDRSCRPHGGCPWCEANRKYRIDKGITIEEELKLVEDENDQ